jgi:Domain of Unknown Function (DUF1080)
MRNYIIWFQALWVLPVMAAERVFDFNELHENQAPPGFRSTVTGKGKPGEWKIILDDVPPKLAPLTPQAQVVTKRAVLAQLSQDPTDEHFPLLVYEDETFSDFTLTTRFKTVKGVMEQMAGIAFRLQDETNYYVLRASSLGNTFRFYKVVNGVRGTLIGPEAQIPSGVWHDLSIACKGNQIDCRLDGKELIPTLTDNTFASGKIAFWTKSDSVSYFTDTKINYTLREVPAQVLVRQVLKLYPRLLGLKVYVRGADSKTTRLVASNDQAEIGQPGDKTESEVMKSGAIYYGKGKDSVAVTLPLRDRNGEIIAAVRVLMKSFPGQTEQNAVARATPIVAAMRKEVQTMDDLVQ